MIKLCQQEKLRELKERGHARKNIKNEYFAEVLIQFEQLHSLERLS